MVGGVAGPNATKLGVLTVAIWLAISATSSAEERTFSGSGPIVVPAAGDIGPASPYPATIAVAGLENASRLSVTLHGVSATYPDDLDVALVSPGGRGKMLVSDACGELAPITGLSWTFADAASTTLLGSGCVSGTYWTVDYGGNDCCVRPEIPGVALVPGLGQGDSSELDGVLTGAINGDWRLFARDDEEDGSGSIGGWSLTFTVEECRGAPATLAGTESKDELVGTPGPDLIAALGGKDTVRGLGGEDVICGGGGDDELQGGAANDRLLGEAGKDRLLGGSGRDQLLGGPRRDLLRGGKGKDVLKGGAGKDNERQ